MYRANQTRARRFACALALAAAPLCTLPTLAFAQAQAAQQTQTLTEAANSETRGKQPTAAEKKMADEWFVKGAFSGNMLHIKASEYALTQVNDEKVRVLAEKLIQDHSAANSKLAALAREKGIELPTEMLPPQKTMLEAAMMVKGEAFATVYLINMTSLHVHDVLTFSHVANDASDGDIKKYAADALPILKDHLKQVKPMAEEKVKLSGM